MQIHDRAFDESQDDFRKMWALILDDYAEKREGFVWLSGRLGDWAYGLWSEPKLFPSFKRQNARLWLDNLGELVGFVVSENCDSGFALLVRPGHEFLYPEMLAWLRRHWGNRGTELTTEVHVGQEVYIRALEAAGFARRGLVAVTRQYDLAAKAKEEAHLADGFDLVDMAARPDYVAKAALHVDAFGDRDGQPSTLDLRRYEYSRENPCYYPSLDFSVVMADGQHVSSCVAFPDHRHRIAEIEKVCTHRQYRRRGLAEAVIRECFRRLAAQGFEYAYITGYSDAANGLYEKLGGCWSKAWYTYAIATPGGLTEAR